MGDETAKLVIQADSVLAPRTDEWLEEQLCSECTCTSWRYITNLDTLEHCVRWAPRKLWKKGPMWIRCRRIPWWGNSPAAQHGGPTSNGRMASGSLTRADGWIGSG